MGVWEERELVPHGRLALQLCCSHFPEMLPHSCRIHKKCASFGGSDTHPTAFLKSLSNIALHCGQNEFDREACWIKKFY